MRALSPGGTGLGARAHALRFRGGRSAGDTGVWGLDGKAGEAGGGLLTGARARRRVGVPFRSTTALKPAAGRGVHGKVPGRDLTGQAQAGPGPHFPRRPSP